MPSQDVQFEMLLHYYTNKVMQKVAYVYETKVNLSIYMREGWYP